MSGSSRSVAVMNIAKRMVFWLFCSRQGVDELFVFGEIVRVIA